MNKIFSFVPGHICDINGTTVVISFAQETVIKLVYWALQPGVFPPKAWKSFSVIILLRSHSILS